MNIIELHQDLINNNNIHQFSIITGEYLYEIMQTYYLPTSGECSFSCPWQKTFTLSNIQEYIEWIINEMDFDLALIIPAIVYIDDLLISSNNGNHHLAIYNNNWFSVILTSILLSQKMYDDEHYENTCFAKLISNKKNPEGKSLLWSIDKINEWELYFLTTINYRLVLMDTLNLERDCKKYLQNNEELVQKGLPIIYSYLSTLCRKYLFN